MATIILTKGVNKTKFIINKDRNRAEKQVTVEGMPDSTVTELTPLEANRQVTDLLRKGWKAVK